MEEKINSLVDSLYHEGWASIEHFISTAEVSELLNAFIDKETDLRHAGIGKNKDYTRIKEIRSDKIKWLEKGENKVVDEFLFDRVEVLSQAINRRCFLGLKSYEFHFAKYEPGAFYKRHRDTFRSDDARKISVIIYLNENWRPGDGGELKIYKDSETVTIQPAGGTIVIFESFMEHEVMMSNKNRYSIAGWLKNSNGVT